MNFLSLAQVLKAVDITDKSLDEIRDINRLPPFTFILFYIRK